MRKKAGAEVEFGNTLLLAENPQGLIIDWELFRESAPADSALLPRSVGRMEKAYGPAQSAGCRPWLRQSNQPGRLGKGWHLQRGLPTFTPAAASAQQFLEIQAAAASPGTNRSTHQYYQECVSGWTNRSKGFAHRELRVTWSVLVHNLWVLARRQQPEKAADAQPQAA